MILCTESIVCGGYQRYAWLRKRAHVAKLTQQKLAKGSMIRWVLIKILAAADVSVDILRQNFLIADQPVNLRK